MTQDRFSAQLRQHLVESANERAGEGQVAAVVDAVARTSQRMPLVARLSMNEGRFARIPSAAIRYGLVAASLAMAMVAGALLGGGAAGPSRSTVFEGSWTAVDPGDGSGLTLVVGRGRTPALYFEDGYATGAACVNDVVKRFTALGTGEISGDRLVAEFPDGGGCGLVTVPVTGRYDYIAGSDTLLDQDDVRWSRVLGEQRPETRAPATESSATRAPLSEPTPAQTPADTAETGACVGLADGGTYTAPAGPLTVTATIPETPAIRWQGSPYAFLLAGSCDRATRIAVYASTATETLATSCLSGRPEVTSFADAVARLDTASGGGISERIDLIIDGHAAARYDVSEQTGCPDGFGLWSGTIFGPGETGSLFVIDVDGELMAIELNRDGTQTEAQIEEALAIIASLQISR